MFYPADSLRRGGRFYLLWVADSWPHRFATVNHRQLMAQDVRKLCDELKEVMISESGRPTHRYSLRLSSQLMRGLVRLYQKKVNMYFKDLFMVHANVTRHSNKRYNIQEVTEQDGERPQPQVSGRRRKTVLQVEEPENEQRIEEILQNSGNVVARVQDITLKEAVTTVPILPPIEGFGEESAEQVLQFLNGRRSLEQMMVPSAERAQLSALELPALDTTEAYDRTRLAPRDARMERISGHDVTLLRPSDGGFLSVTDLGKEIPDIPDVPILPIPEFPDPQEKQPQEEAVVISEVPHEPMEEPRPRDREGDTARESTLIELEELEEIEPRAKRRRKLIIDKKIQISSDVLRARIQNPRIELRCKESSDALVDIQLPHELYMSRPCRAGFRARCLLAPQLVRLFMRNLGVINRDTAHREFEAEEMQRQRYRTRSHLDHIPEVPEVEPPFDPQAEKAPEFSVIEDNLVDISKGANELEEQDISDMITQKLDTLSQQKERKRVSDETTPSPKRQRSIGYMALSEIQQRLRESAAIPEEADKLPELEIEVDKENVAAKKQTPVRVSKRTVSERSVTAMLQEAGLSDAPPRAPELEPSRTKSRRQSGSSETLLGSLDRTRVSLGDSITTTDSKRFITDQWGAEGTMLKLIKHNNARRRGENITVTSLVARGPIINGYINIITAKCFSSILKLKQHGFIAIKKCPTTLEILDIVLGPSFQYATCD